MGFINDQQRNAYISALINERDGYERAGNKQGVKEVTDELQNVGAEAKPKAKRAEKRPETPAKETR